MISLCSKPDDLTFFFLPFGGVKPVEMTVTHILQDTVTGKQYFVFTPKTGSFRFFAREFLGDIKDKRFFTVKSEDTLGEILRTLRRDGLRIERMDIYAANDS